LADDAQWYARQLAVPLQKSYQAIAQALESATAEILAANADDCQAAVADGIPKPLYNRLKLDEMKLRLIAECEIKGS